MMSEGSTSERHRAAALSLAVDSVTAQVVRALEAEGIPSVLLKGPTLAWLYDGLRTYRDSDLLVPYKQFGHAERILLSLGFERLMVDNVGEGRPWHARSLLRSADAANVDLHRTIAGARVDQVIVWDLVNRNSGTSDILGVRVTVPSVPCRVLMVALHAAMEGGRRSKPLEDLRRAVDRVPAETWAEAVDLSREIETEPIFAAGLRMIPEGSSLADGLKLPEERSVAVTLREGGAPPLAVALDWMLANQGIKGKAKLVARELFPTPAFMRDWSSLARRGLAGLVAAYAWRPVWLLFRLPTALVAVVKARRAVR